MFDKTAFKVEGDYEKSVKEGISRATVGAGVIAIRDQAAQDELEASGKTAKLAALNRDLNKAQEITKEERSYVKLYVSDTSIKHAAEIIEESAELVSRIAKLAAEHFDKVLNGEGEGAYEKALYKLKKLAMAQGMSEAEVDAELRELNEKMQTEEGRAEIAAQARSCSVQKQGFNLLDLIAPKAHAAVITVPAMCIVGAGVLIAGLLATPQGQEALRDTLSPLFDKDRWLVSPFNDDEELVNEMSRDNLGEKSGNLDENRWIAERVNDCRLSHQAQAVFVS